MHPSCCAVVSVRPTIPVAVAAALSLSLLSGAARAQALREASPPSERPPSSVKAIDGWPGLMGLLRREALGLPVIAAGYGPYAEGMADRWYPLPMPQPAGSAPANDTAVQRLAEVARLAGTAEVPYTLIRAGRATVIAPATREAPAAHPERFGPWVLAGRGALLDRFLSALSDRDVTALGRSDGVEVRNLSPEARAAFLVAMQPPLRIVRTELRAPETDGPSEPDGPGDRQAGSTGALKRAIVATAPGDWSAVPVRARLAVEILGVPEKDATPAQRVVTPYPQYTLRGRLGLHFEERTRSLLHDPGDGVGSRLIEDVPNTPKPSDLSTATLPDTPVGVRGIFCLKDLLGYIRGRVGLRLSAQSGYMETPVFIGSETLACRDVLNGLCLALEAAWRRTGDTYYLVWDRDGFAAVQQRAIEATRAAVEQLSRERLRFYEDTGRLRLGTRLPFDPDALFVPTPEQRKKLLSPPKLTTPNGPEDPLAIRFSEMTREQQDALRLAAARVRENASTWAPYAPLTGATPLTDEGLERSFVRRWPRVIVSVDIPGTGWVECSPDWSYGTAITPRPMREPAGQPIPPKGPGEPVILPLPERAVVAPPLDAGTLKALAPAMAERGFQTLFYPVLSGGYATIRTEAFPRPPGDAAGFIEAVDVVKPHGIRVVGYIETLAWQRGREPGHWLEEHPDWIDVDMLGRTRAEWAASQEAIDGKRVEVVSIVRVREPEVERRLRQVIGDFSDLSEGGALAFLDWNPTGRPMGRYEPPPLGYAMPDRLDALARLSDDPLDTQAFDTRYVPRGLKRSNLDPLVGGMGQRQPWEDFKPYAAFIERLLRAAKEARPGGTTYLFEPSDSTSTPFAWTRGQRIDVPNADIYVGNPYRRGAVGSTASYLVQPLNRATEPKAWNPPATARRSNPDLRLGIVDLRGQSDAVLQRVNAFAQLKDYPEPPKAP